MQPHWHEDVARHLREAATSLSGAHTLAVRRELGTAIGYLLRAAAAGDDDAFEILKVLRSGVDDAEPTQIIDLENIEE
jgi:predicted XRE-type DNA-binding protein